VGPELVTVAIGGTQYSAFPEIKVMAALDHAARSFALAAEGGGAATAWRFAPDTAIDIYSAASSSAVSAASTPNGRSDVAPVHGSRPAEDEPEGPRRVGRKRFSRAHASRADQGGAYQQSRDDGSVSYLDLVDPQAFGGKSGKGGGARDPWTTKPTRRKPGT
jgi:hypothetical protein